MKVTSGIPAILSHSSTADLRAVLESLELLTPVGLSLTVLMLVSCFRKPHPLILFLIVSHFLFSLIWFLLAEMLPLPPCPLALCLLLLLCRYSYVFNDSCCFPRRSGPSAGPSVLLYASKMRWNHFGFASAL